MNATATANGSVKKNRETKPQRVEVYPEKIPKALRDLDRWLCWAWRWKERKAGGKWDKPPLKADGSGAATSTDPETWGPFATAFSALVQGNRFDGLGVALGYLGDDLWLVGVDFDNCRKPSTGEIAPRVIGLVGRLNCYTEVSPSGEGLKCLMLGKLPAGAKSKFSLGDSGEIEIYQTGRYFTVTSQTIEQSVLKLEDRTEQLSEIYSELAGAEKIASKTTEPDPGGVRRDALDSMLRYSHEDGEDGSKRLYFCGCRCVELDLTDKQVIATVRELEKQKPFPRDWSDDEILQRVRDAERKVDRGTAIELSNAVEFLTGELDKNGNPKIGRAPISMRQVRADVSKATGDWPRRVGSALFIHDPTHGVGWLEKAESTFGWLQTKRSVKWYAGTGYVNRSELHAELQRTATAYDAVESCPHFPRLSKHYYACPDVTPGGGKAIEAFLNRFRPSTTVDRDLILAAIVTTFWGGSPGARPAFIFTSDAGRGAGKTKAVELITLPSGGFIDVSAGEDIGTLKSRLLSPEALSKRNCLLDNVKSMKFSWAELEAQITTPLISGRRLYVGEGSRPNVLTWFITLNGVSLSTDLAQRCVIIKLDRGENSGTWYEESLRFVNLNRDRLIADVAAFMQGEKFPLAKFSRWGSWEADVLSRLPEPGDAQALILERQGQCDSDQDEAELIEEFIAEQLGELQYNPRTCQVRIPNAIVAEWYCRATNDRAKTPVVSRKLKQMADERQLQRLAPDPSRTYGRGFIYTGPEADIHGECIANDLKHRISHWGLGR